MKMLFVMLAISLSACGSAQSVENDTSSDEYEAEHSLSYSNKTCERVKNNHWVAVSSCFPVYDYRVWMTDGVTLPVEVTEHVEYNEDYQWIYLTGIDCPDGKSLFLLIDYDPNGVDICEAQ